MQKTYKGLTKSWKCKTELLKSRDKQVKTLESKLNSAKGELQSQGLQIEALESRLATYQEDLVSRDLDVEALRPKFVDTKGALAPLSTQMRR